ncbi:MAG: HEPN domain-containing protein [Desulfobacterota bacterium]|nr:HEPN domain-containing protein [Thermodesulfobacteriota bacterium]
MDDNINALIKYRIARAKEAFEEAMLMRREGHCNACMNRLYYASFYAVTALLAKDNLSSSKHIGVKSLFNQHYIKTGKINREYGLLYNHLFENRQEGDYVDFVVFDADSVDPLIPQVKEFIEIVSTIALTQ